MPVLVRACLRWCLLLCLGAVAGWAQAQPGAASPRPVVQLSDAHSDVDAWPQVRVLAEPAHASPWSASQVWAALPQFEPPHAPHANLGVRREGVWFHLPLQLAPDQTGRWLLDLDYPALDRVDAYLVRKGQVQALGWVGDERPYAERPLRARSHVLALNLPPGESVDLLLRVQTTSTMTVPLRLLRQQAYAEREAGEQAGQGLLMGMSLFLLLYSLSQSVTLREASFACYGLTVLGTALFSFSYTGMAGQHLWPHSAWLTANAPPLCVMLAELGAALFVDKALRVGALWPRLSLALRASAAVAALGALAFVAGLMTYRSAHLMATVLGLGPIVLGLPAAWLRMRGGDRAALYIVLGWGVYAVGIVVLVGLLRGWLPYTPWTQHAFQLSAFLEMLVWMLALGARVQAVRHEAERAGRERELMRALAHSDPLTGLPNRRGLHEQLTLALKAATPAKPLVLLVLDLDGFKAVNDRLGHEAGDQLLLAVGQRLRQQLRAHDVVARLGGDEFVILAPGLADEADARQIGDKLLAAFAQPFSLQGEGCRVGLTIGYALAPLDATDPVALMRLADAAMYQGKQAGKHQQRRCEPAGGNPAGQPGTALAA